MKYIRTENGIYEVLSEYDTPENTTLISNPVMAFDVKVTPRTYEGTSIRIIYSNEVVSQADTIEELCDSIVETCISGNRVYDICEFDDMFKNMAIQKIYTNIAVNLNYKCFYGAIWTSKGLIYVAKMNEKGDLELI